jgi:MoxR-like ATPase
MNQPASDFDPLPTPELPTEPVALVAAPPSPEDQVAADLRAVADIARAHADLCAEIEKRIVGQRQGRRAPADRAVRAGPLHVRRRARAWRRRCSSRRWREALNLKFSASSSRPTSCRPTSPAPRSSRRSGPPAPLVPVHQGPGLRQPGARRRDQPHAAQDAGRAARGDAGVPQVTAGGVTPRRSPLPFLVFATQNPIEQEGTYPLPEAQLDRFMFKIDVDYPTRLEEEEIVRLSTSGARPKS